MTATIRDPKPGIIMVEKQIGLELDRRYVAAHRAGFYRRIGWTIWKPAGTGWTRDDR